jgi:hypothetical protein
MLQTSKAKKGFRRAGRQDSAESTRKYKYGNLGTTLLEAKYVCQAKQLLRCSSLFYIW